MIIFWTSVVGVVLVVSLADGLVRYLKAERRAPRALSAEDRLLCSYIADGGLGRPWICRRAIEKGRCACLPCRLLEKARDGSLFATPRGGPNAPYLSP